MLKRLLGISIILLLFVACSDGDENPASTPEVVIKEIVVTATPTSTKTPTPKPDPSSELITPPSFKFLNKHPKYQCLNITFNIFIDVFGVYIVSVDSIPKDYVEHTAKVFAEFIDNNRDGIPDDNNVLDKLIESNYVVPVWTEELREQFWEKARGTFCEDNTGMAASMYYGEDEWAIGGIEKTGTWDGNLEEIWHIVSRGWYEAYPEAFGNQDDIDEISRLREALDLSRGGKFEAVPTKYPDNAWYTYYDPTCGYHCQVSEYFYWALMANIGALDPKITNKCEESNHEWNLCTKSELKKTDQSIYKLLNDSNFNLPKNIPSGNYNVSIIR